MDLPGGTMLGSYEVLSLLGKGGMGEVYRARDSKLKREVAIKVLPEAFARDAERVARFQREAEVLASLNHPYIAAIHDLAESGESQFLVLELVEGETLADRIARGPIPLDDSLAIAKQIGEALEAAHEKGITHRDLKPSNVKLTLDGTVKVLDFGLAKVRETQAAGTALSNSPTMMTVSTPGLIMGTAAYMSPEQAKGKEADRGSDIWSFGCVLYEMLTGKMVFEGETVARFSGGVFKTEPDWRQLPAETPASIRRLLRRCLQKDRRKRLPHIGDARIEIDEAESGPEIDSQVVQRASGRRQWFAWISFAVVTVVAAVAVLAYFRAVPPAPEMRFEISVPPTTSPPSLAISPDGQRIVYAASSDGQTRLWLRSLDSVAARPLRETDFASYPFWSPDGRSIGFFADGKLKRIDIDGGSAQTLANAAGGLGGTWNQDGTILFAPSGARPIYRVPATGGEPFAVTSIATPHQTAHRSPQFLPDGRHFLYYAMGTAEGRGVYVSRIDGAQGRRLTDADWGAVLASSGQLFFIRNTTLFAQDFDSDRLVLTGSPYPVAEQMSVNSQNAAGVSASMVGPIVYRSGSRSGQRQLAWFDRSGKEIVKIGASVDSAWRPSLSPNGRRVALTLTVNGNTDIWLAETTKGVLSRFTFAATGEYLPIWSPDGTRIIFNSNRNGPFDFYQKAATGAGSEELVLATLQSKSATDWSSDGRFLLYRNLDDKLGYDLWALPLLGDRKPFPVVQTDYDERDGQFSPDGKWIAYQSNESGRFEIYVQPFPGPGSKWQVSTNGGAQVRWRRDGRELFYIALDDRLMAAPLRFVSNGQAVETDAPVPLFATRVGGAEQSNFGQQYNVSPDGQRFLMNTVVEEAYSFPITVILNWKPKT